MSPGGSPASVIMACAPRSTRRPVKGSVLKSWALSLSKRAGMRKAKVALARKLAVVLHTMMRHGKPFSLTGGLTTAGA